MQELCAETQMTIIKSLLLIELDKGVAGLIYEHRACQALLKGKHKLNDCKLRAMFKNNNAREIIIIIETLLRNQYHKKMFALWEGGCRHSG